jgi:hypothetical protein
VSDEEWKDSCYDFSLWIDNVDCEVGGNVINYPSLLFIPSVNKVTAEYMDMHINVSENENLQKFVNLSFYGMNLFTHRDLKFSVGYKEIKEGDEGDGDDDDDDDDDDDEERYVEVVMEEIVIVNETFGSYIFETDIFDVNNSKRELEWMGWIIFSNNFRTEKMVISFLNIRDIGDGDGDGDGADDDNDDGDDDNDDESEPFVYPPLSRMTWVGIFVMGALFILILLFILFAIISKRLKKWWKKKNKINEMVEENDNNNVIDEKNGEVENSKIRDGYVKQA